ncbi:conserved hypothetical protein [uncultured Desulfatiglans sp.]|nr:conserved hypothetical protein [uncultured Desulfatiglans sp.]
MRKVDYQLQKESFKDMAAAGRLSPCLEITFRDRRGKHIHKIGAGYSDDIAAFRENGATYILSLNPALGYAGLEAFEGDEKTGDVFLQGDQLLDLLGDKDLGPVQLIYELSVFI